MTKHALSKPEDDEALKVMKKIFTALRGLKFGSLEITVHEGRIVQIERREKQRLNLTLSSADIDTGPASGA